MNLLPAPRSLTFTAGSYPLEDRRLVLLDGPQPQELRFSAGRFLEAMRSNLGFGWEMVASRATPANLIGLVLRLEPACALPEQGYRLQVLPDGVRIEAGSRAGLFYGVCTLVQILEQCGQSLPCLEIVDWPDFPARGVLLDVSRDKVPSMDTLLALVDLLAGWKINQLQLYTEHTFAYRQHPEVWSQASPLTGQEILELDAFCRERFVELVPNQNSFGHMRRWLSRGRYAHLAETLEGFDTPWGRAEGPFSLCPEDAGSLALLRSLYDELLPHFSSRMVNVGCDETFDLGQGRSREACQQRGAGRVYLDFLLAIYNELKPRGYTVQFWADVLLGYPQLLGEFPRDALALVWGYEANHPFDLQASRLTEAGIPFYVCPGTSSWCSLAGRTDNAAQNLLDAAENGLKHGACGYLITDWGDNGHWQFLPVSYAGFLAGAAYSWALESNRSLDLPCALNQHAFRDSAGVMGQVACNLGNIYRLAGIEPINASVFFNIFQTPFHLLRSGQALQAIPFDRVLEAIDQAAAPLSAARMDRPDGDLIRNEFALTADLLRHACRRGRLAAEDLPPTEQLQQLGSLERELLALVQRYEALWLARNRPGGLADSLAWFEKARQDYRNGAQPALNL